MAGGYDYYDRTDSCCDQPFNRPCRGLLVGGGQPSPGSRLGLLPDALTGYERQANRAFDIPGKLDVNEVLARAPKFCHARSGL